MFTKKLAQTATKALCAIAIVKQIPDLWELLVLEKYRHFDLANKT